MVDATDLINELNKKKEVKPTIATVAIIPDDVDDPIGKLCKKLFECQRNTLEFKDYKKSLIEALRHHKAIFFEGDNRAYQLGVTGESFLYHVPLNKTGHLKVLRGKFIRLVCIGSSYRRQRHLSAHILKDSPK